MSDMTPGYAPLEDQGSRNRIPPVGAVPIFPSLENQRYPVSCVVMATIMCIFHQLMKVLK